MTAADRDPNAEFDRFDDTQAPFLASVRSPFLAQNTALLPPEVRYQGRTGNAHDNNGHWTAEAAGPQAVIPQSGPGDRQTQTADSGNAAPQRSQAPARSVQQDIAALDRARDERLDQLYALKRSDRRRYQSREVQSEIEALEATKHDDELQHLRVRSLEKENIK
jgi:hypothetical protein